MSLSHMTSQIVITPVSCMYNENILTSTDISNGYLYVYSTTRGLGWLVCWSLTSLCHSNGHIVPAREINPFTALTRIRSQFLRTQWSTSNHQRVRAVRGLISRAGMVSICPLLWQRDVKCQQTKLTLKTDCCHNDYYRRQSSHLKHHIVLEMTTLASIVVIVTTVCFQCTDWDEHSVWRLLVVSWMVGWSLTSHFVTCMDTHLLCSKDTNSVHTKATHTGGEPGTYDLRVKQTSYARCHGVMIAYC